MGTQSGRSGGIGTGRTPLNPPDCPRVTRKQVLDKATSIGLKIRRDGQGMWERWSTEEEQWYNLGQTNYIALQVLIFNPRPWLKS